MSKAETVNYVFYLSYKNKLLFLTIDKKLLPFVLIQYFVFNWFQLADINNYYKTDINLFVVSWMDV